MREKREARVGSGRMVRRGILLLAMFLVGFSVLACQQAAQPTPAAPATTYTVAGGAVLDKVGWYIGKRTEGESTFVEVGIKNTATAKKKFQLWAKIDDEHEVADEVKAIDPGKTVTSKVATTLAFVPKKVNIRVIEVPD